MDILIFFGCFAIIAIASKQIGQSLLKTGLPLISGFLFTGIIAGPYMLDLISKDAISHLKFVDEISLGFIAFTAGGELYLKELKNRMQSIAWITSGLVIATFTLGSLTLFFIAPFVPFMSSMSPVARAAVSILGGAILVARSPSSAIAVVNELRAKGPFTQTVLGVTVIMDVVVIILFAINSSIADALFTGLNPDLTLILLLLLELSVSVGLAYIISKFILIILAFSFAKEIKTGLVLLTGYAVFLFSGWVRHTTFSHVGVEILLEPLLICMIAGFLTANTRQYRVEFLSILAGISLPIYISFFTLTGASLSLDILIRTWPIAILLFLVRGVGIFTGSFIGGIMAKYPLRHNSLSWMAYITQAGVGLGLAKEVVVEFPEWGNPFATVIISVIVLNQIVGPPLFKRAIKLVGEDHPKADSTEFDENRHAVIFGNDGQAYALALSLVSRGWTVDLAVTEDNNLYQEDSSIHIMHLNDFEKETLESFDCQRAGAIVAMMSDEKNFLICEMAYEHFGTQTLIARLNDRKNFLKFQVLGVLIVDPSTAIVSLLDHFVRSPAAASLLMGMHEDRNIVDIRVKNLQIAGLALRDLRLPFDTIIMSIRRRGVLFIPHDYTRLEAGDLVTLVGSLSSLEEMSLRFDEDQDVVLEHIVQKAVPKELINKGNSGQTLIEDAVTKSRDRFDDLVEQSMVIDLDHQMGKEEFFKLISGILEPSVKIDATQINQMLVTRENEVTTVLAPGLAVPHIIVPGKDKFAMLIVRSRKGIGFAVDQPGVYAAFVLMGSKDKREFHLQALSAIAQIVMDPVFEKKWMRAKNVKGLKSIVLNAQRKRRKN